MTGHCSTDACTPHKIPVAFRYRRALWIALFVNTAMFGVESTSGWIVDSASLLADALDFLGDAANYSLSLFVLAMVPAWRSRAALIKGLTMGGYGTFVLGKVLWSVTAGAAPQPLIMGWVGLLALVANGSVAALLYAYRNGDADMRSVWLCTRNDVIGNIAVMLAALGVFGTGTAWPDLVVAALMGGLALAAARAVIAQSRKELRATGSATFPIR